MESVKEATLVLMENICEKFAVNFHLPLFNQKLLLSLFQNEIPVQMSIEISPQHHFIVAGRNYSNLKEIMMVTGAQIIFPDAEDPNVPNLKKSNIKISGNINSVYAARQLLIVSKLWIFFGKKKVLTYNKNTNMYILGISSFNSYIRPSWRHFSLANKTRTDIRNSENLQCNSFN